MTVSDRIEEVTAKGYDEKREIYSKYIIDDKEGTTIADAIWDLLYNLRANGEIKDYTIEWESFDNGPSSEPGVVFFAWIGNDGELNMDSYVWDNY